MTTQRAEARVRAMIQFIESAGLPFTDLEPHPADGPILGEWLLHRSVLRRSALFHEAGLDELFPELRKAMAELREEASMKMANLSASSEYNVRQVARRIRLGTI